MEPVPSPYLIELNHPALVIDLIYATTRNFTGKKIYHQPKALLHVQAAHCLYKAANLAQALGLKLHIWDMFRPPAAQRALWQHLPDPKFVAPPDIGSDHSRAIAVDLTLEDETGHLLDMGTDFDAAVEQSFHGRTDIPCQAQKNRFLLLGLMRASGFIHEPHEWWHYSLPHPEQYALIEKDF